jgi:glycine dehydrogenase
MAQKSEFMSTFADRHIGPSNIEVEKILSKLQLSSLDSLIEQTVPQSILRRSPSTLIQASASEEKVLEELRELAKKNRVARCLYGLGYHDTVTPLVIQRNILENPGWYTQYTPYQAEIAQGRLEALLNFQTLVSDLTGLPVANASLLDEATAVAEAMAMSFSLRKSEERKKFYAHSSLHPQNIDLLKTRAEPLGIEVVVGTLESTPITSEFFGAAIQYPSTLGLVEDPANFVAASKAAEALVTFVCDPLSLVLLKSPGSWGADIAVGSLQRFGVPMGFGGPAAAFFSTKEDFKRSIPGRIVGVSKDVRGKMAIRLALQTREQHIRREKATSNICTAQVLLAVMSSMYAVYHGPKGLRAIAHRIHQGATSLAEALSASGFQVSSSVFDTLHVTGPRVASALAALEKKNIFLRQTGADSVVIALDERSDSAELSLIADAFGVKLGSAEALDAKYLRTDAILSHPVFNQHHSEHEMLRYMSRLERKDLSLNFSMIALGSCTMKLNATVEMTPVTWPEFGSIHPAAPASHTVGYREMLTELESMLTKVTGFDATSLQPNAGSQGEYSGLLVIRAYHRDRGESHRNVCLIPKSAHGTNPASAAMAGMKVVVVECDRDGNVDIQDLKSKCELHQQNLAALMVTYPSTHGVFESRIREICELVHVNGGQVYMDGANMNAQIGLCQPGEFGADVCHLNLHKTFCIPHGGGGPGMGPICVKKHLAPFLPSHRFAKVGGEKAIGSISAAPWGSASILPISYVYMKLMGMDGLRKATEIAILNANYIASRLNEHYPVLYKGEAGFVAHECIIDLRPIKAESGVEVEDVAKRLMDYGFHAPTVSFPVAGTMMIEPTESENLGEMDRFCDAMIEIRKEISEIAQGKADPKNNLLKNAPHSSEVLMGTEWPFPYSRERAAFPLSFVRDRKFHVPVSRIDNVFGDRNLVCSCPPIEDYA